MFPSSLIWLWLFQPNLFLENGLLCTVGIALYFSYISVGLIKFRQFANLHLHSTRVAAVMLYLFIPFTLIAGQYNSTLFQITVTLFIISSIECFIVLLTISEFNDRLGSLVFILSRQKLEK